MYLHFCCCASANAYGQTFIVAGGTREGNEDGKELVLYSSVFLYMQRVWCGVMSQTNWSRTTVCVFVDMGETNIPVRGQDLARTECQLFVAGFRIKWRFWPVAALLLCMEGSR